MSQNLRPTPVKERSTPQTLWLDLLGKVRGTEAGERARRKKMKGIEGNSVQAVQGSWSQPYQ